LSEKLDSISHAGKTERGFDGWIHTWTEEEMQRIDVIDLGSEISLVP
jgi:hypothetical protein